MEQSHTLDTLLTVVYVVLCLASLIQMSRIFIYRHNHKSFQFAFLCLVFLWTFLRAIFFADMGGYPGLAVDLLYWLPVDLQFATYSLLVLFYVHLLYHKRQWHGRRQMAAVVYGLANFAMLCLTVMYIFLLHNGNNDASESLNHAHHLYMSVQFLVLVLLFGYYGLRLAMGSAKDMPYVFRMVTVEDAADQFTTFRIRLVSITVLAFIIFASRCVYNFCGVFNIWTLVLGDDGISADIFVLLFVWEVVPTCLVLAYFSVPATPLAYFGDSKARRFLCCERKESTTQEVSPSSSRGAYGTMSPFIPTIQSFNTPKSVISDDNFGRSRSNSHMVSTPAGAPRDAYYGENDQLRYDTDDEEDTYTLPPSNAL